MSDNNNNNDNMISDNSLYHRGSRIVMLKEYNRHDNRTVSNIFSSLLLSFYITVVFYLIMYIFLPLQSDRDQYRLIRWIYQHKILAFLLLWLTLDLLPVFTRCLSTGNY